MKAHIDVPAVPVRLPDGSLAQIQAVADDKALLLQSCEALIAGREYMRTKPKPRPKEYRLIGGPLDRNGWMAA